jgi:hypothetical protein
MEFRIVIVTPSSFQISSEKFPQQLPQAYARSINHTKPCEFLVNIQILDDRESTGPD